MTETSDLLHTIARDAIAHQTAVANRIVAVADGVLARAPVTDVIVDRINGVDIEPLVAWSTHSGDNGLRDTHFTTVRIINLLSEFAANVDDWTVKHASALLWDEPRLSVDHAIESRAGTMAEFVGDTLFLGTTPELVEADLIIRLRNRLAVMISLLHYQNGLGERWDDENVPQVARWVTVTEPWDEPGDPDHPGINPPVHLSPGVRYLSDRYQWNSTETGEPRMLLYNETWDEADIPARIVDTITELGR